MMKFLTKKYNKMKFKIRIPADELTWFRLLFKVQVFVLIIIAIVVILNLMK
jgi:hypothetical protein